MSFDHNRWRNTLAGVQSLTLALGVIIGGFWTWWTFGVELSARRDAELHRAARLTVTVNAIQVEPTAASARHILVEVRIRNTGTRESVFDLRSAPLSVARVVEESGAKGGRVLKVGPRARHFIPVVWPEEEMGVPDSVKASLPPMTTTGLRPGEEERFQFLAEVAKPGMYIVSFTTRLTGRDAVMRAEEQPADVPPSAAYYWQGSTFINVR